MLNTRFNLCAGDRMTTTYYGHDMAYLNLLDALLISDYFFRVVRLLPALLSCCLGRTLHKSVLGLILEAAPMQRVCR